MQGLARVAVGVTIALLLGVLAVCQMMRTRPRGEPPVLAPNAEFHFIRMEYTDLFGAGRGFGRGFGRGLGRGWWMQDWPASENHFAEGVHRLTRIDIGEGRHVPLTDDRVFDYPWIYATQVGYWDLSDAETTRLREYLLRGGFLVVDDFWGPREWDVFRESMQRVCPDQPIVEIREAEQMMHVLYDVDERAQIPGLRHLWIGAGGTRVAIQEGMPPHWRAIYDANGRMVVAICFNMDVGDAWEHADLPQYPAEATGLAYRFGINSIIYSMTH